MILAVAETWRDWVVFGGTTVVLDGLIGVAVLASLGHDPKGPKGGRRDRGG